MGDSDSMLFPNLPDDLSIQCIARVPRSSHPSLVLVSRSWRSLLRSRRLFSVRADLGVTEPSLCICTIAGCSGGSGWCCRWYFLNLRPCSLRPLPPPPFPRSHTACAALGSSLYVLGGRDERTSIHSFGVQIFDACLNRWTTGPPMPEGGGVYVTNVFEGRIYVFRNSGDEFAWADVLDPESGVWASLPRRPAHLRHGICVFRGQLLKSQGFLLDPEVAQLQGILLEVPKDEWLGPEVVLDGVLYACNTKGELGGYDPTAGVWKPVQGVEGELPTFDDCAQLTNMGGLLCFVWIQRITGGELGIHCVGVEITRTGSGGFLGSIAWHEALGLPFSSASMVIHSVVLEF